MRANSSHLRRSSLPLVVHTAGALAKQFWLVASASEIDKDETPDIWTNRWQNIKLDASEPEQKRTIKARLSRLS